MNLQEKAERQIEANRKWARGKGKKWFDKLRGGDLDEQERKFLLEMDIRQTIRKTREQLGLSLEEVSRAIKDEIGEDLPFLIKELAKYETSQEKAERIKREANYEEPQKEDTSELLEILKPQKYGR